MNKMLLLTAMTTLFCAMAQANVQQIYLGQNATLNLGDAAIISSNTGTSVVSCGGNVVKPTKYFTETESVYLPPDLQEKFASHPEYSDAACNNSLYPFVNDAIARATVRAKQHCINEGYKTCAAPTSDSEKLGTTTFGNAKGNLGCNFTVRIIGSN